MWQITSFGGVFCRKYISRALLIPVHIGQLLILRGKTWALIKGSSTLSKVGRILTKTFMNFHDHAVEQNWWRSQVPLEISPSKDPIVERTLFFEDNYDQPSKTPSSAATPFF